MLLVAKGRDVDRLGRQIPRNPFAGAQGLLWLLDLPGFAEQFKRVVPAEYLLDHGVACVCGEFVVVEKAAAPVECPGKCGRWFLRTAPEVVRVARWRSDEEEAV